MHTRRLVAFLLGVWLGGMIFVAYITSANFTTTRNILENGGETPRRMIELSGRERATPLLMHNTAEINRSIIEFWEWLELGLGVAVVCTLPFAMRMNYGYLIPAVLMLIIVAAQRILLTPEMVGVGRMLDMAGGDAWTQDELWRERRSLHTLEMLYWSCEGMKAVVAIGLTAVLLIFRRKAAGGAAPSSEGGGSVRRRRRSSREKSDAVDDADYSHVDGRVGTSD